MQSSSKIYVAGHRGLVGSALVRRLEAGGYANLVTRTHAELDLEVQAEVERFFAAERPEYVFLAAAKVGGINANCSYPADFILSNIRIESNVIEAAHRNGVKGLLFLGSSCIYPKLAPQPLKEEYLLTGPLESTNEPYAIAKIAGIGMCEALNRQYGTHFLSVMPTNLYGPNDSYDLENSHVLPALIRKFHLARLASLGDWAGIELDHERYGPIPSDFLTNLVSISRFRNKPHRPVINLPPPGNAVKLWGTGSPRREFLHADDLADACILLAGDIERVLSRLAAGGGASPAGRQLVNIGCGKDRTIEQLAVLVASVVGFQGAIEWDKTSPDGTPQKLLDIGFLTSLGWKPRISLKDGISDIYQQYVRGVPKQAGAPERFRRRSHPS